jgi:DNA-binding IclR family transcriptional regulator
MLTILALFNEGRMSIQLDDAVQATGGSRATAYRYIQSLSRAGLLASASGGRYVLGARVIELDHLVRRSDPFLVAANPLIREAAQRFKTNIMLCSYYGDKVMCADLAWPDRSIAQTYERGKPMPMFRGAMAKVILANLTPYQLRNMMLWHADQIREAGLGENWDAFRSRMAKLRKDGFCITRAEVVRGLVGIGAPVFDPEKRVLGSVVFVIKVQNFKGPFVESLTEKIMVLAKEITRGVANELKSGATEPARAARPRKMAIGKKSAA